MRALLPALFAFALAAGSPLAAQQRDFGPIHARLVRTSSVQQLRQWEFSLTRGPEAAAAHTLTERGLVLMRLYELTSDAGDADAARRAFEEVLRNEPNMAWAHYGLGLLLVRGPDGPGAAPRGRVVLGQSIAEILGKDPATRAERAFLRAIELSPDFDEAALELAELMLRAHDRDGLVQTRAALQRVLPSGDQPADVALALARVEAALGNLAAAADAASLAAEGSDRALALHARAAALLRDPNTATEGLHAYHEGIDHLTEAAAEEYFAWASPIATNAELRRWTATPDLEGRRGWLRTFWTLRAARAGVTEQGRIAEHFRRFASAQERYRRRGKRGASPGGAVLRELAEDRQLPFDDRGLMLLRHGEPEEIISTISSELRPNETWVYPRPEGGNSLYHFIVLRDGTDFRAVDDLLVAVDPTVRGIPTEAMVKLLNQRAVYEPLYKVLAMRMESAARKLEMGGKAAGVATNVAEGGLDSYASIGSARERYAADARALALAAFKADSDRPRFDRPLPFFYDVYSFRGENTTDLTAALAVPGESLQVRETPEGLVYSLAISFIVVDTVSERVTRVDTTYHLKAPRSLSSGEYVRLHLDMTAAPSANALHRVVVHDPTNPSQGQLYGGALEIPGYETSRLSSSDIVIAERESGSWHRGNAHLSLVPPRQFEEGSALTIFYELYNLPANAPYRTEIVLQPTDGGGLLRGVRKLFGGGPLTLRFEERARPSEDGLVQEIRQVTPSLKAGRYEIRVTVTNLATEQSTIRRTRFIVLE